MLFTEQSYEQHRHHYEKFFDVAQSREWFQPETVDGWRHERMFSFIKPFLRSQKKSKWVTIGDGRYGIDSIRLKKIEPTLDVLPTDIDSFFLEKAKEQNIISDYKIENAEKLSFKDNEFDFVLCKETYHHLPRPFSAVYEMLRVASKAIVLIEPNDNLPMPFLYHWYFRLKNAVKTIIKRSAEHTDQWRFEKYGNYVHTISRREMQKAALGLRLPVVAWKYFNDCYVHGVEKEKCASDSKFFRKIKRKISMMDLKNKLHLSSPSSIVIVLFTSMPGKEALDALREKKFEIDFLPENPFA